MPCSQHIEMNNKLIRISNIDEGTDRKKLGKRIRCVWLALCVTLLAGSFYYTISASVSKSANFQEILDEYSVVSANYKVG